MSPQEINVAIAEECGWVKQARSEMFWNSALGKYAAPKELPDYYNDLNTMHEVIMQSARKDGFGFQADFQLKLQEVVERRRRDLNREQIGWCMNNATSAQRAEAFLRMKGKWKE